MSKRIIKLDASALVHSGCMRYMWLNLVDGWQTPLPNNDMEYGSGFHKFIQTYKLTDGNIGLAVKAAKERFNVPMNIKERKKYLTETHLIKTCLDYVDAYPNDDFETLKDDNGKALVEIRFAWPYYEDDDMAIIICGTIDDLCKHRRGCFAIRDYKTTSSGNITEFFRQYHLSCQLKTYYLAIKWYGKEFPDSIIGRMSRSNFACFIDGIFLRGQTKDVEFKRSEMIFFKEKDIEEYEYLLRTFVHSKLIPAIRANSLPPREGIITGSCNLVFGHCKYFDYCAACDDIVAEHLLKRNFVQKDYNPMTHGD